MLRITPVDTGDVLVLRVEGRLVGPWVEELRTACVKHGARCLDLRGLQTADAAGRELLRELAGSGKELRHLSGYIAALISEL